MKYYLLVFPMIMSSSIQSMEWGHHKDRYISFVNAFNHNNFEYRAETEQLFYPHYAGNTKHIISKNRAVQYYKRMRNNNNGKRVKDYKEDDNIRHIFLVNKVIDGNRDLHALNWKSIDCKKKSFKNWNKLVTDLSVLQQQSQLKICCLAHETIKKNRSIIYYIFEQQLFDWLIGFEGDAVCIEDYLSKELKIAHENARMKLLCMEKNND